MNRAGAAPGVVGALLLLQLVVLRVVASADAQRVFVFGRELHWGCWFRERFGVPCPTCGMTRSTLLAVHGQLGAAWHLNPAGALLAPGLFVFACALLFLACYQLTHPARDAGRMHAHLRRLTSAYAALFVAVLVGHWLLAVATGGS